MNEVEQLEIEIDALAQTLASTVARAEAAEQRAEAAEREVAQARAAAARDRHEAWACGHAAGFRRGLQRDPLP